MIRRAHWQSIRGLALDIIALSVVMVPAVASAQWSGWGGPDRNFMVKSQGLADSWPEGGPAKLWHRALGDGYATIVVDDGVLYTMYRTGGDEFSVALNAKTGETLWERKNPSPVTQLMEQFGPGPFTTPQVAGDRVFTIGTNAVLHCFEKKTGKVLWKHDLPAEFGAPVPGRGYGCSPIAYKDMLIVPVDRKRDSQAAASSSDGQTLVAFDQMSGSVVWKSQDFRISYASPIMIDFEGETQLVQLMADTVMGVNPDDGSLLWKYAFTPPGANLSTPLFVGGDTLFCSSAYDSGSRAIKLSKEGGKTVPEQLWYSRKMRIHHGNAVGIGDHVFASSGDFGPAFFVGLNVKTGKAAWRKRGFKKSTCVLADGKLIILDEDGLLSLATVTPDGLTVHSTCSIAERYAWAAPTLVGKTLYVRDRKHIMALDLG